MPLLDEILRQVNYVVLKATVSKHGVETELSA